MEIITVMYGHNKNVLKINNEESKEFTKNIGVKHGCVLNPLLISMVVDEALTEITKRMKTLQLGRTNRNNRTDIYR